MQKEETTKKLRQTLNAHILEMAWQIQLKFGIGGREFAQKKLCVSVQKFCPSNTLQYMQ